MSRPQTFHAEFLDGTTKTITVGVQGQSVIRDGLVAIDEGDGLPEHVFPIAALRYWRADPGSDQ